MKIGSIDIGTNAVLLLVVDKEGYTREVLDHSAITRLGEGIRETGTLKRAAIERTVHVVAGYLDLVKELKVEKLLCVGTAALREAKNSAEFLTELDERFGLPVRVISAQEEAFYTYLSVREDRDISFEDVVIFDIGGGSTEVVWGDRMSFSGYHSLPVGSVKLTETFLRHDPPSAGEIEEALTFLRSIVSLPEQCRGGTVVGTAGTVTTMAALIQELSSFDKKKIHGFTVTGKEISALLAKLSSMKVSERAMLPGMESGREDVILGGILLASELLNAVGKGHINISTQGVRYGLIYEFLASEGSSAIP